MNSAKTTAEIIKHLALLDGDSAFSRDASVNYKDYVSLISDFSPEDMKYALLQIFTPRSGVKICYAAQTQLFTEILYNKKIWVVLFSDKEWFIDFFKLTIWGEEEAAMTNDMAQILTTQLLESCEKNMTDEQRKFYREKLIRVFIEDENHK